MNTKKIINTNELTISFAPWIEQLIQEKEKGQYRVPDEKIAAKLNREKNPVPDPAKYIFDVQMDAVTGKQYKMVETLAGKKIRVPVSPENNPDEPLYTQEEINLMGNYLLNSGQKNKRLRNYAYFIFTINTWRRAGDNLGLKISHILNSDGSFKDWLVIEHEGKTQKKTSTPINSAVQNAFMMYLESRENYSMDDLLFPSDSKGSKMTVDGMCKILQRAAKALGMTQKIGTHSLRKTGAYHYYMIADDKAAALEEISRIFKHSSITITRRYVMIEQETIKQNFEDRKLEVKFD